MTAATTMVNNRRGDGYQVVDIDTGVAIGWTDRAGDHELRIDHVPDTHPGWVGAAADLDAETDRRSEPEVIDILVSIGTERRESVALYHDDGHLEWLVPPPS